jgi:hypothetical protein
MDQPAYELHLGALAVGVGFALAGTAEKPGVASLSRFGSSAG